MSECRVVRASLDALVTGPDTAWPAEVAAHVSACEPCARAVAAARLARGLVLTTARGFEPRPEFAGRVMAAVARVESQTDADPWHPAWALLPAFGSVAAALLVLLLQGPGGGPVPADWPGLGGRLSAGERLVLEPGAAPDQDLVLAAVLEGDAP